MVGLLCVWHVAMQLHFNIYDISILYPLINCTHIEQYFFSVDMEGGAVFVC